MSKRRPYVGPSEAQINADALVRRSAPFTGPSAQSFSVQWDWRKRQPRDLREAVRMVRAAYSDEVPSKLHDGPDAIGPDGTPRMTARAESYIFGDGRSDDAKRGKCTCVHPDGFWQHHGELPHEQWEEAQRILKGVPPPQVGGLTLGYTTVHDGKTVEWEWKPYVHRGEHQADCPANPQNQDVVGYYHAPFRARLAEMSAGDERERKRAAIVSHVSIGSQAPVEAAMAEGVPAWCARLVAEDALRFFLHSMSDLRLHLPRADNAEMEGVTAA